MLGLSPEEWERLKQCQREYNIRYSKILFPDKSIPEVDTEIPSKDIADKEHCQFGCKNLETRCTECGRLACSATIQVSNA